jgi:hypothetical protein
MVLPPINFAGNFDVRHPHIEAELTARDGSLILWKRNARPSLYARPLNNTLRGVLCDGSRMALANGLASYGTRYNPSPRLINALTLINRDQAHLGGILAGKS